MLSLIEITKQKWFVVLGSIFLLFMLFVIVKQINQKRQVQKQIDALRAQANEQIKKNQDFENFIAYLKTDEYKQKAARGQMNLKKEGEFVYSFQNSSAVQPVLEQAGAPQNNELSNPRKWWNYFFHPNI